MQVLLSESIKTFEVISEQADGGKRWHLNGVFGQAEIINKNKRWYPGAVMESAVSSYQPLIEKKSSWGELNHPQSLLVNPERACIYVYELGMSGKDMIGKSRVLESVPMGKLVAGLLNEGMTVGVSTRAAGSVTKGARVMGESNVTKVDKMNMIAVDVVHNPSAPNAYPTAEFMAESVNWMVDIDVLSEQNAQILTDIKNTASARVTKDIMVESFAKLLSDGIGDYLNKTIKSLNYK